MTTLSNMEITIWDKAGGGMHISALVSQLRASRIRNGVRTGGSSVIDHTHLTPLEYRAYQQRFSKEIPI